MNEQSTPHLLTQLCESQNHSTDHLSEAKSYHETSRKLILATASLKEVKNRGKVPYS